MLYRPLFITEEVISLTPADWFVFHGLVWPGLALVVIICLAEQWLEAKISSFSELEDNDSILDHEAEHFWRTTGRKRVRRLYLTLICAYILIIACVIQHAASIPVR